jgi:hypothetical protein
MTNNTEAIYTLSDKLQDHGFTVTAIRTDEVWIERANVRVVLGHADEQVTVHIFDGLPSRGLLDGTMTFRGAALALAYTAIRQLG